MRHLRWLPPEEWPQVPVLDDEGAETGETRDATERELEGMDLLVVGPHPAGGSIVDCLGREGRDYPGWPIAAGAQGGRAGDGRYGALPPELKRVAYRAAVYREPEGAAQGLRDRIEADLGASFPARLSPRSAGRLPEMEHRARDAGDALERARELAVADPPEARRVRVPLGEVREQDVVEDEARPARRWAGEG